MRSLYGCLSEHLPERASCEITKTCRKDLLAHYGCVNAVEFSSDGGRLASGGDDRQAGTSCSPSQHEHCALLNDIDCARQRRLLRSKIMSTTIIIALDIYFNKIGECCFGLWTRRSQARGSLLQWWRSTGLESNLALPRQHLEYRSNIFCLGFDSDGTRLYSGGNDEQVGRGR